MSAHALDFEVAVVIPVRNGARFLGEALASVLSQDLPPREVVVVDDGSTDGSGAVAGAAGPLVRVLRQAPAGTGAARCRGIAATSSPWIAFLDADDRWAPGKLRLQRAAIEATSGAVAAIGHVRQFFDVCLGRADRPSPEVMLGLIPTAVVVRRDAYAASGGFPIDVKVSEFAAWWVRFLEMRPVVAVVPEVVAERRLHDCNVGVVERRSRGEYVRLVKEALDRRRGAQGTS